jgi:urease accessory protein
MTVLISARAVRGELCLRAELNIKGHTVLAHRHASGSYHLSKPYWDGHALMVQWINPTAGIFAGDVLTSEVHVDEGASLLLTTPSATRIHTRLNCEQLRGQQRQHFHVADRGFLEVQSEWLIPQRGSAFSQDSSINLEPNSGLFYTELLAPGRLAHGEALVFDSLEMKLRLRVGNRLVIQDHLRADTQRNWMLRSADGTPLYIGTALICVPTSRNNVAGSISTLLASFEDCCAGLSVLDQQVFVLRMTATTGLAIKKALHALRTHVAMHCPSMQGSLRRI